MTQFLVWLSLSRLFFLSFEKSFLSVPINHEGASYSSPMPCSHATLACSSLVAAIMGCEILRGMGRGAGGGGAADWLIRESSSGMQPSRR